jgi:hypothetical protein
MSEDLPSCPFCGEEAKYHPTFKEKYQVECSRCKIFMSLKQWKRRTPGPATNLLLEQWRKTRSLHRYVGIPDEIVRVYPKIVDAVLEEFGRTIEPCVPQEDIK